MGKISNNCRFNGFALPSVLIASIVMLTVLLAAVTSTSAVRTSLASQYYNQLSQTASDAGMAYAKSCLDASNGVPRWSDASPLMPNTNCEGEQISGFTCPANNVDTRCAVMVNGNVKTSFSVGLPDVDSNNKATVIHATGIVSLLRESNNAVWRTYDQSTFTTITNQGIVTSNLVMNLDAGDRNSYTGTGTSWTDLSGNNSNGVLFNAGYSSSNNGVLTFNGSSSYVSIENDPPMQITGDETIEFWIKPNSLAAGRQNILDKAYGGEFSFTQEPSGDISYYYGTSGGQASPYMSLEISKVAQGQWQEVTLVRNLKNMTLYGYINGNLVSSAAAQYAAAAVSSHNVTIGVGYTGVYYNGSVGAVHIYNRALSDAEVQQNYSALSSRYFDRLVQLLVVAGGGTGGGGWQGGGGGGGGVVYVPTMPVTSKSYAVTVGVGGTGGGTPSSDNGNDSIFDTIVAKGGGAGAGEPYGGSIAATSGGSGGGGSHGSPGGPTVVGAGTAGQGNNGGQGISDGTAPGYYIGGGGGGAGAVGQNASYAKGGNGGNGLAFSISGSSVYYGGGGAGSFRGGTAGTGGLGGGGNGGTTGANGAANTGGGGGAGNGSLGVGVSGSGGSGIVIVSYPTGSLTAIGGTITTSAGRTIHTFTSSGSFVVSAQQRTSCLAILNAGESTGNGIYWIYPSGGVGVQVYCDMTTAGGGWTLILCNPGPYTVWNMASIYSLNSGSPSISTAYSILNKADSIKTNISGNLQYRIDAVSFGRWGGVWQAPYSNTFVGTTVVNNATNLQKFDAWNIDTTPNDTTSLTNIMPWIGNTTQLLSTWGNAGSWFGTLATGTLWSGGYSPYITPEQPTPSVIWYWVK